MRRIKESGEASGTTALRHIDFLCLRNILTYLLTYLQPICCTDFSFTGALIIYVTTDFGTQNKLG